MIVVVATDEEYEIAKKRFKHKLIIKTGVGGVNVINKLRYIPRFVKILNFGFVGSTPIPVGTEVKIGEVKSYHPNVEFEENKYKLNGDVVCYTAGDFVTASVKEDKDFVVDMELIYIVALGFKKVESIKIVSDTLNLQDYSTYIKNYN